MGNPTTTITSYGYQRNNAGKVLIDPATGLPLVDPNFKVRGDRNPNFTLGWINNITYKDLRVSFLWDLRVGGDIFNATEMYMTLIGRSQRSVDRMTPRVVAGVLKDGLENSTYPTANSIAVVPYYQQTYYTSMPEEEFIQKNVNAFRLRDITFNYNIRKFMTEGIAKYTKTFSVFLTVNDAILITNYKGADPAVGGVSAGSRGVGAFGFDYGNMGAPVSFNMGIRTTF